MTSDSITPIISDCASDNGSGGSSGSTAGGNTKTPAKRVSPAKKWCFVLNNWTDEEVGSISSKISLMCSKALVAKEIGENGTPHLQGFIEFKTKQRPMSVFDNKRIHWDKARGNLDQQWAYITKQTTPFISMGFPKPVKLINPDYSWEQDIIKIIMTEPDDRHIYWYWSKGGCIGKTSFCKYLTMKHNAIALSGKASDMRNGVVEYHKANEKYPELILIPIPRSFKSEYLNYEGIENIKDMYFYSGKYEGGMVCGNCPHVFVFANEPPDKEKMSLDRWIITQIDDDDDSKAESNSEDLENFF